MKSDLSSACMTWNYHSSQQIIFLYWIIKQAESSKVTNLTRTVDIIAKMYYIDIDYIVSYGIPADQFKVINTVSYRNLQECILLN